MPETFAVQHIRDYDLSLINRPLIEGALTFDIAIIHAPQIPLSWTDIQQNLRVAQDVFGTHGIQLNVTQAIQVDFPNDWNGISIRAFKRSPIGELAFYDSLDFTQSYLPPQAERIFSSFADLVRSPENTIVVVSIADLLISWYEKGDNEHWREVSSKTSAISFPPYIYADRIPLHLRGLISFSSTRPPFKTLAHELGHKLINVSHEACDHGPRGDGKTIPGLMGYGDSLELFGGSSGRWHKERLLLSPFLYRKQGKHKIWNKPYQAGGIYSDPIYGEFIVNPKS